MFPYLSLSQKKLIESRQVCPGFEALWVMNVDCTIVDSFSYLVLLQNSNLNSRESLALSVFMFKQKHHPSGMRIVKILVFLQRMLEAFLPFPHVKHYSVLNCSICWTFQQIIFRAVIFNKECLAGLILKEYFVLSAN